MKDFGKLNKKYLFLCRFLPARLAYRLTVSSI